MKYLSRTAPLLFSGENGEIVGAVLVFRDVSDKRLKLKSIEYLSYHDNLTGLYNRRFYEIELARIDTCGESAADTYNG